MGSRAVRWGWMLGVALAACRDADGDGTPEGPDCDDASADAFPGATEVCNGRDDDCDGLVDEDVSVDAWQDRDGDGFGDPGRKRRVCVLPSDAVSNGEDCDDADAAVHPSAAERCNGVDDDCDTTVDEGASATFFVDADGDGHGDPGQQVEGCVVGAGWSRVGDDCDDTESLAWSDAPERCDGVDNDCDAATDEDLPLQMRWADTDGDGGGDPEVPVPACVGAPGTATAPDDCDDQDAMVGPYAAEVADNGGDEDCDGHVDEIAVPDHVPTLEAALALAAPGDVVQLGAGLWTGPFDLRGEDVVLAGEGCERTVLYGELLDATLSIDGGEVRDLTLTGGARGGLLVRGDARASGLCITDNVNRGLPGQPDTGFGGGVDVQGGRFVFEDSLVARNEAVDGGGLNVAKDATLVGRRLQLLDNHVTFDGGGAAARAGRLELYASVLAGNRADDDGGALTSRDVAAGGVGSVLLDHCTIVDNEALYDVRNPGSNGAFGSALFVRLGSSAEVRSTLFAHHDLGDEQVIYADAAEGLVIDDLGFAANTHRDLALGWDVPAARGTVRFLRFVAEGDPTSWDLRPHPTSDLRDLGAWSGPDALPLDLEADLDGDELPDAWERLHGLETGRDDAALDPDGDGLDHAGEWAAGSDPRAADTDGDGLLDGDEIADGRDPLRPDVLGPYGALPEAILVVRGEPTLLPIWPHDPDGAASLGTVSAVALPSVPLLTAPTLTVLDAEHIELTANGAEDFLLRVELQAGARTRVVERAVEVVEAIIVPDDAATLAIALSLAGDGDTIALRAGVWEGEVRSDGRDLRLVGLGAPEDVVLAPSVDRIVTWTEPRALALHRLTLTGGDADVGGGVLCTGCSPSSSDPACDGLAAARASLTLREVHLTGNRAEDEGGALRAELCDVDADQIRVVGNQSDGDGGGLWLDGSALRLVRSLVADNEAFDLGGGVRGLSGRQAVLVSNTVFDANASGDGAAIAWAASTEPLWAVAFDQLLLVRNVADTVRYQGSVLRAERGGVRVANVVWAENAGATMIRGPFGATPGRVDVLHAGFADNTGTSFGPNVGVAEAVSTFVLAPLRRHVDPLQADWRPRPGSALLEAGWHDRSNPNGRISDLGHTGGPLATGDLRLSLFDTDGDGLPDGWEQHFGLDARTPNASGDPDADGRTNGAEYSQDRDPTRPD